MISTRMVSEPVVGNMLGALPAGVDWLDGVDAAASAAGELLFPAAAAACAAASAAAAAAAAATAARSAWPALASASRSATVVVEGAVVEASEVGAVVGATVVG